MKSWICNRLCCLVFIAIPIAAVMTQSTLAVIVFDLKTDWSDAANPNGPWSYRQGNNVLLHVTDWQGLSGDFTGVQPAWARAETGATNLPAWMKIVSPAGITVDWQLGDIVTHSTDDFNGVGSGASNVIWTSPLNGTIDVSGGVWMGRDIGRSNHWEISKNGIILTGGDIFSGDPYQRSNPFTFSAGSGGLAVLSNIPVLIGDVFSLQITRTSVPGDYVGINLSVTATCGLGDFDCDSDIDGRDFLLWQRGGSPNPFSAGDLADWQNYYGTGPLVAISAAVPEPSTWMLLALAAMGSGCTRRRRIAQ